MKVKKNKGKYYQLISRTILYFAIAVILIGSMLLFLVLNYVLEEAEESNNDFIASQMINGTMHTKEIIDNYVEDYLNDPQIYELMHVHAISDELYFRIFNDILHETLYTSGMIDDVYVYNSMNGRVYSTKGYLTLKQADINEILARYERIQQGTPIFRTLESEGDEKDVFTYFYANQGLGVGKNESFIAVDVLAEQAVQNIEPSDDSEVIILNNELEVIGNAQRKNLIVEKEEDIKKNIEEGESFTLKANGETYNASGIYFEENQWYILSISKNQQAVGLATVISLVWIVITGGLILIAVKLSERLSRYIYKPVKETLQQINEFDESEEMIHEFDTMQNTVIEQEKERCNLLLKRLIQDSEEMKVEQFKLLQRVLGVGIDEGIQNLIVVIRFLSELESRDYDKVEKVLEAEIKELFQYNCIIRVGNRLVILFNGEKEAKEKVRAELLQVKNQLEELLEQSVAIATSDYYSPLSKTSLVYKEANNLAKYRMLGMDTPISTETVKLNLSSDKTRYDVRLDIRLKEMLYKRNKKGFEGIVDKIFEEIIDLKFDNMKASLLYFTDYSNEIVNEINSSKLFPQKVDLKEVRTSILEKQKIQSIKESYLIAMEVLFEEVKKRKQDTQSKMLEAIKTYIEENYMNQELCPQSIATKYKFSAKYLSFSFKEYTGYSLAAYIQMKRVEAACYLLEHSSLSISEIVFKIGLENENYFYTLFKKNMGVTPKQYRQSKIDILKSEM